MMEAGKAEVLMSSVTSSTLRREKRLCSLSRAERLRR